MRIWKASEKVKDIAAHNALVDKLAHGRQSAFQRFPLLFTLLATFGVVTTFYGFEHIVEKIPFLANNPIIALTVGVLVLVLTGTLYKKL